MMQGEMIFPPATPSRDALHPPRAYVGCFLVCVLRGGSFLGGIIDHLRLSPDMEVSWPKPINPPDKNRPDWKRKLDLLRRRDVRQRGRIEFLERMLETMPHRTDPDRQPGSGGFPLTNRPKNILGLPRAPPGEIGDRGPGLISERQAGGNFSKKSICRSK